MEVRRNNVFRRSPPSKEPPTLPGRLFHYVPTFTMRTTGYPLAFQTFVETGYKERNMSQVD